MAPKIRLEPAQNALGGDAYASSETIDRMASLRKFYAPFVDLQPGIGGLEGCESLSTP